MPHPDYTLPREAAAVLARSPTSARYVSTWYTCGNHMQALAALRTACAVVLACEDVEPDDRCAVAMVLADIEPLR